MGAAADRMRESRYWVEVEDNCYRWTERAGLAGEGSIVPFPWIPATVVVVADSFVDL